jgi:PAS domain S-box-containing protein
METDVPSLSEAVLGTEADAIIAADDEGIIRFWNAGAARIFGYSRSDALGQSLDIIIPEHLRARHWAGYRQVMASGTSRYGQSDVLAVPGVRKDGSRLSLEFTITVLRDQQGRVSGVAAILRDVTARFEELRSLEQKVAQLSQSDPLLSDTRPGRS